HRLAAITVARVAGTIFPGQMVVHLCVQSAFGQRLLQRIQQTALLKGRTGSATSQKLIEKFIWDGRLFASRHMGLLVYPLCPTTHENPDTPPLQASNPRSDLYRLRAD